jgi:hypothetical protein
MQFFFNLGNQATTPSEEITVKWMALLGQFLLEIRRSMGNETTTLDSWGMLEWFITDARKYRR